MRHWRGRDLEPKDQVANALDSFVDLAPSSEAPAALVKARWAALLPGQDIPLIGEDRNAIETEDERREFH
jgi:hypothetical protein